MNCQDFETVVRDVARTEGFEAHDELFQAFSHVQDCSACELRLEDERELSRKLSALSITTAAPSSHVETILLHAYRQTLSVSRSARTTTSAAVGHLGYWFAAAAAVLLILIGFAALRVRLQPPKFATTGGETTTVNTPAEAARINGPTRFESTAIGSSSPIRNARPHGSRARRSKQRLHGERAGLPQAVATNTPSEQQTEPEIATQFIALSAVGPVNLQDGGQIVRVEVSRLAMASFGFPVNMDRSGERVKADVLLSADGFARAIRFIQ
jgi:hypothetical protein